MFQSLKKQTGLYPGIKIIAVVQLVSNAFQIVLLSFVMMINFYLLAIAGRLEPGMEISLFAYQSNWQSKNEFEIHPYFELIVVKLIGYLRCDLLQHVKQILKKDHFQILWHIKVKLYPFISS